MSGPSQRGCLHYFTRRCSTTRKLVSFVAAVSLALPVPAFPQQIIPDGKTNTSLSIRDNVTDVTTSTIRGVNAYNSFSKFDVYQGNVVNLHVPGSAANLLNLVHDQASSIDGVLNAYKDGRIGGNVFFANPHGFLVGASGTINVGALTVMTPTKGYMDGFFDSPGNPSSSATAMLLNGTAPIDPNGLISIRGKVNARGDINLSAGTVQNAGAITSCVVFPGDSVAFSDLVNTDGLESGAEIAVRSGVIEIVAARDFSNTGAIVTDGAANRNAGEIHIKAGNDVALSGESVLSARGHGENSGGGRITVLADRNAEMNGSALIDVRGGDISGDGGFIELSAKEKVLLGGGIFRASAEAGKAGRVLIDPDELIIGNSERSDDGQTTAFVNFSNGGNIELTADESITVNSNVILSTRMIDPTLANTAENHLNALSKGSSGNISLSAPQITLNNGAMLLAHAINEKNANGQEITSHTAGNITLTATDTATSWPFLNVNDSTAKITLNGATLKGKDIKLEATAHSSMTFDDNGTPSNAAVNFLDGFSILGGVAISNADAEVLINGTTIIDAATLTLNATAQTNATVNTLSKAIGVAYGESNPTAKVIVGDGTNPVIINTTGDVKLNSKAESYLNVNAYTVYLGSERGSAVDVTFAYGQSTINSTAQIAKGVDAGLTGGTGKIGGGLEVKAEVLKNQNLSALSGAYEDGAVGGAAAVSISTTNVNALVDGAVNAAKGISILADSRTPKNDTSASTEAGSGMISGLIVKGINGLWDKFSSKAKTRDSRSGSSSKLKLSGAVAYADHETNATAAIGESAEVSSQLATPPASTKEGILVKSTIMDVPEIAAISMVDSDAIDKEGGNTSENSISAAVVIGNYTNNASASIGKNAVVDARLPITVSSKTWLPWEIQWDDIDTDNLAGSLFACIKDKLNPNLGIQNGFFTSWAQSMAQGSKTAIAGSVNVLDISNTSKAFIDEGAKVNQDLNYRSGTQDVKVMAENETETLNLSGILSLGSIKDTFKDILSAITRGKISPNTNRPGTAGVGGSYLQVGYTNNVEARIEKGAQVHADSLQVEADSTTRDISIGEAGGKAGDYAINGVFSLLKTNDTTIAKIDDGAVITTGSKVIPGDTEGDNVLVKAHDEAQIYNISGGISKGENVGVGISVSINEMTRDTEAMLGNRDLETNEADGSLAANGNVRVAAANSGLISSWSLAGAIASSDTSQYSWPEEGVNSQSPEGKAKLAAFLDSKMKNPKKEYGLGISGDVSVNLMTDTAKAYISDTRITKAGNVVLDAVNDSEIAAYAGSGTYTSSSGKSVGIAGAVTWNELKNTTKAFIDNSTLENTGDVSLTADSAGTVKTIAASGSGAVNTGGSGIGIAGSLAFNYIDNDTSAFIKDSSVTADPLRTSDISLVAKDDSAIWSISGAGSYGGKAGIGASVAVNMTDNTTEAYTEDSDLSATGSVRVSADERSKVRTIAAALGVAKEGMAVAASASGNDLANTTRAYISGKKTNGITANGNVSLAATDDADILSIAGNISADLKGGGGFGVSASVTVTNNLVEAYIGSGSIVTAKGLGDAEAVYTGKKDADGNRLTESMKGVAVTATSYEDIISVAAGGGGAEKLAVEGSAAVHVLNETTAAHIDGGAQVTAGESDASGKLQGTEQDVIVRAFDTTDILGIAGAVMGSLQGGIGAGADVGVITKNTQAYIGNNANVQATKDIRLQATSAEDINSIAGTIAVGKEWAFGGAASVYVLTNTTRASVEGGNTSTTKVHAEGSIQIAAANDTEIDSIAGSGVFGMSAGIGASAATAVINKSTEAYVGTNATVEADGKRDAIDVATGRFTDQSQDNSGDDYSVDPSDTANLNLNADVDTSKKSAAETKKLKGLAVTAVATDDVSSIAASGGGSGTVAINLAGSVNVIGNNTSAYIADGARINTDQTSSGDGQSVLVAAGTDFRHLGIGAAAAISGQVGLGPAAEVTVVDNNTYAYIGKGAQVAAKEDVEVVAASTQDILSITGAGALGVGAVGLAGSVSVVSIDNDTFAYVGDRNTGDARGLSVKADGNIVISARDKTKTEIVTGSLAGGTVGIGGAIGVTLIEKDTKAFIGNNAEVDAKGNSDSTVAAYSALDDEGGFTKSNIKGVAVQAESSEEFSTISGAFAGGFAGLAGAVVVNTIESDTTANIGDGAKVSQDRSGVNSDQSVQVAAVNDVTDFAVSGSVAGGAIGLSGGLGFHTIKNDTTAYLGNNATVTAEQDVGVTALADKETETYAVSAAGGMVGLAGGVTILTIGDKPDDAAAQQLSGKGGNTGYSNPSSYAESQARYDFLGGAMSDSYGMGGAKARAAEATAAVTVAPTGPLPAGTAAFIGKSATVTANRDISVNAKERIDVFMGSGAVSAGIGSLGGSVGIANVRSQVRAYIDGDDPALASSINGKRSIAISAELSEKTDNRAFAGALAGFLSASGAVTYVNDDYLVDAHIGSKVTIDEARHIAVTAKTTTDDKAESLEGGLAGLGLAVGVSYAEVDADGTTTAYLGDSVKIGTADGKTVDYLTVTADASNKGDTNSKHLAGGIIAGGYNESDSSINPTVTAAIGTDAAINLQQDLTVGARADVNSTAYTWGGAFGGVAVGVGAAEASATPVVSAFINGGAESDIHAGGDIRIKAYGNYGWAGNELVKTIKAENDATAGSIFFSDASPTSTASGTWTVAASVGADADIETDGALELLAKSYTGEVKSDVDGNSYSLGALGNNLSNTTITQTVSASIGEDATITADNVDVNAHGKSNAFATTYGGSGGILAGASATANSTVTNTVTAGLAGNKDTTAKIKATRDIAVSALSEAVFNAHAASSGYGFVGSNGARITNTVTSTAKAFIGTNADVAAGDILVSAANTIRKYDIGANLSAESGGFWGGPAGDSMTTITSTSTATLAGNSSSDGTAQIRADRDITLAAANDVFAFDKGTLTAGGAIAVADVHSTITDTNTATASIGENAVVKAGNDVNVDSKTSADVEAVTYTEGFGLGASADGKAEVTVTADNDSNIAANATVKADNDINVFAGKDPAGWQNRLRARAEARSFSAGGIPFSSVEGYATLNNYNDIMIATGTDLKSGRDINLGAYSGSESVEGVARAKLRTYLLFGIPITWYSDGPHSGVPNRSNTVTVNGAAESGLNRHRILHIDAFEQVSSDSNIDYTLQKNIDGVVELQARINDLDGRIAHETDENVKILLSMEKARYEASRDEIIAKRNDPSAPDPAYGWFDRFSVADTMAGSGDINIAGTLKGNGTLKVPGNDFKIEILNDSLAHLELHDLDIPIAASGSVNLNNRSITSHGSVTIENGANAGKRIIVENRYDPDAPGANENAASDMVLKGDITNYNGTVDITNLSGSIESLGDVIGDEVTIIARREFNQNYIPGVWNSPDSVIGGGNINISGQILNIKGTIQSGTPYHAITIPEFDPATDLITKGNVQNVIPTTGDSNIMAVWDAEHHCIQLYNVKVTGGNITLAGEIVSTGNGKLKVIDGYGEISIENNSSHDLVVNKLDVDKRISGMIKITDTGKLDAEGHPLVTEIRGGSGGNLDVVQYRVKWDPLDGKVKTVDNSYTSNPVEGRQSEYQPRLGARFLDLGGGKAISNSKPLNIWEQFLLSAFGQDGGHAIGVEFTGSAAPRVDVNSTGGGDVLLNSAILNRDGDVSIKSDRGSIYSLNDVAEIRGRNISLAAPIGDVGNSTHAIKIDTRGGQFQATAIGTVNIEETAGDLTIGSVMTAGDVKLTAEGSILGLLGGAPAVSGRDISLLSKNGGIGTADNNLGIDSAGGTLTAEADKGIYLAEATGGMRINRVASSQGDVVLTAQGQIEDYNFAAGFDDDTLSQLDAARNDLGLENGAKVQEAIEAYRKQKKEEYQAGHRISNNGTPYEPGDDVYDAAYNPNWQYTLTGSEQKAFDESVWKTEELVNAKNIATLPGPAAAEEPNVSGRNVTIITSAGVGTFGGQEIITAEEIRAGLTPDHRMMIVRAEKESITQENGNLIIQLRNDMDIQATGTVAITARDHVYLSSGMDLKIDRIDAGSGDIRLNVAGDITSGRGDDGVNLAGNSLTIETVGGVGSADKHLVTDLGPSGALVARARDNIFLEERSGDLFAESIVSRNGSVELAVTDGSAIVGQVSAAGDIRLATAGAIVNGRGDDGVNLAGSNITIEAAGGVGSAGKRLVTDAGPSGALIARVRDNIFLEERSGDLAADSIVSQDGSVNLLVSAGSAIVGQVSAAGDIRLATTGVIANGRGDDGVNLIGNNITLAATAGSIGSAGKYLVTDLGPSGALTAWARNSLFLEERSGDLFAESVVSRNGPLELAVTDGSAIVGQVFAAGDIRLTASGAIGNGRGDAGVNLVGNNLALESAAGEIGSAGKYLVTDLGPSGVLTARARDSLFLEERSGDLAADSVASRRGSVNLLVSAGSAIVGQLSAPRDLRLTASGAIVNGRGDAGVNLAGNSIALESAAGGTGSAGKYLVTNLRPSGVLTARARDSLFLEERSGDLAADSVVSRNGSVNLLVAAGSATIEQISAPGTVSITANGPGIKVRLADAGVMDLRDPFAGAAISVARAEVGRSVTSWADTVLLGDILHTGQGVLRFDVRGGSTALAGRVEIGAASTSAIAFDHLHADTASVKASADRMSFLDTRIGSRGDFYSNRYHVIADNRDRSVRPSDLQLYATAPFSLELSAGKRFATNALVVNYGPGSQVNEFSTENSFVGTTEKMLWTGKRGDRHHFDPAQPGISPSVPGAMSVQPGSVGLGGDDRYLDMENVDVVFE